MGGIVVRLRQVRVEPDTPRILADIPEMAEARDFAEAPRRPLTFPALVVGSSNDHFAEGDYAARFATDLGAGFVAAGRSDTSTPTVASATGPRADACSRPSAPERE